MTVIIDDDKDYTDQSKSFPDDRVKSNYILQQEWLQKVPTPIFYKDVSGRYLGCNRAFEEFMNIERNNIIGKTVHEVWPEKYASIYKDKDIELMEHGGSQTYEFQVQTLKGEVKDVIFYKSTFQDSDGKVGGLIGSI
ncbi:MAG: PAS domain-containing protein, partial [Desulfamplus sp.]|nr:PAS domain-containing protein [Desulfamplus sp.]